jgi:hypothetical protein
MSFVLTFGDACVKSRCDSCGGHMAIDYSGKGRLAGDPIALLVLSKAR